VLVIDLSEDLRAMEENGESHSHSDQSSSLPLLEAGRHHAFIQRLPQALSYVAELESGAHAILFYDNLVAAAEYLCAFIEQGMRRQQVTNFLGLSTERYQALFDQVGINTATLENSGYLRHVPTRESLRKEIIRFEKNEMGTEDILGEDMESNCQGTRFILLNEYPLNGVSFRDLMELERWLNTLSPATVLCCYDARQVLDEAYYNLFPELLKTHGHSIFQGIAMPTNTITGNGSITYPAPKSLKILI